MLRVRTTNDGRHARHYRIGYQFILPHTLAEAGDELLTRSRGHPARNAEQ